MKKICLISAYFGKFPDNIQYFFESVKYNSSIDFICYSDCDTFEEKKSFYIYNKDITYAIPERDLTTALDIINFYIKKIGKRVQWELSK